MHCGHAPAFSVRLSWAPLLTPTPCALSAPPQPSLRFSFVLDLLLRMFLSVGGGQCFPSDGSAMKTRTFFGFGCCSQGTRTVPGMPLVFDEYLLKEQKEGLLSICLCAWTLDAGPGTKPRPSDAFVICSEDPSDQNRGCWGSLLMALPRVPWGWGDCVRGPFLLRDSCTFPFLAPRAPTLGDPFYSSVFPKKPESVFQTPGWFISGSLKPAAPQSWSSLTSPRKSIATPVVSTLTRAPMT